MNNIASILNVIQKVLNENQDQFIQNEYQNNLDRALISWSYASTRMAAEI